MSPHVPIVEAGAVVFMGARMKGLNTGKGVGISVVSGVASWLVALAAIAGTPCDASADPAPAGLEWPQFRGPGASGIGVGGFPDRFGPGTNEAWAIDVPPGNSSPVISGQRLFLTGFSGGELVVLALDARTGREAWRRVLAPGRIERGARLGNPATATCATDGRVVVSYFGPFGLVSHDMDGTERWRHPLPTPLTQHGAGTSPVIVGDLVLLNQDQDTGSYLLAVGLADGRTRWRVDRPHARRGFSTPLAWPPGKPEAVVVAGTLQLDAYRVGDGSPLWRVQGLPNEMVSSPVAGDGMLFVAGWTAGSGVGRMPAWDDLMANGDANHDQRLSSAEAPAGPARQHFAYLDADKDGQLSAGEYAAAAHAFDASRNVAMAVRPGGVGDVTGTAVLWTFPRGLPYCPTPLLLGERLWLVRNGGLVTVLDARTGRAVLQEERLGTLGDHYASPVASGDRVCIVAQSGTAVVLRAGDTLDVVARNPLGDAVVATPAIAHGRIHVRTATRLHAFGPSHGGAR